jgi:hypothetical protein
MAHTYTAAEAEKMKGAGTGTVKASHQRAQRNPQRIRTGQDAGPAPRPLHMTELQQARADFAFRSLRAGNSTTEGAKLAATATLKALHVSVEHGLKVRQDRDYAAARRVADAQYAHMYGKRT